MIYYSKQDNTFYDSDIHSAEHIAADAVAISSAQHMALLHALNSGCLILDDLGTTPPRPSAAHEWDGKAWVLNEENAAQLKAQHQAAVWEKIKQKRYHNTHSGVYVERVQKWFHTDEASRIQYVALQMLPSLPEKLQWKTMDGSFVAMTKELLGALLGAMILHETADFQAAEVHRAKMLKAKEPLNYDYSGGWQKVFEGARE